MQHFFYKINSANGLLIVFTILISILTYIIIWIIFKVDGPFYVGDELCKRDWLAFLSGFLVFIGTLVVSVVALLQNDRYKKMDEKRLRVQNIPNLKLLRTNLYEDFEYKTIEEYIKLEKDPRNIELLQNSNLKTNELISFVLNCPLITIEEDKISISSNQLSKRVVLLKEIPDIKIFFIKNYGLGTAVDVSLNVSYQNKTINYKYEILCNLKEDEYVLFEINFIKIAKELFKNNKSFEEDIIIESNFRDILGNEYKQKYIISIKINNGQYYITIKEKDNQPTLITTANNSL